MQILEGMDGQQYVYIEDDDDVVTLPEMTARNAETQPNDSVVQYESVAD